MIPAADEEGLRPLPAPGSRAKAEALTSAPPKVRIRAKDAEAYPVLEIETEDELMTLFREVGGGSGILPEDIADDIFACPQYLLIGHELARRALRDVEHAIREAREEALRGEG